ncbi:MAG: clostripain-related cysteine peptidase [bacterium]
MQKAILVILGVGLISLNILNAEPRNAQWTIMVFMNGDNNLEHYGIEDFNEMEQVGSFSNVNIIVQFDRAVGYDYSNGNWTTCRRYRVTHDNYPDSITSELIEDLGEVDMGDPNTLANFGTWAKANYPANNYLLVLWDHGDGWREGGEKIIKGVSYDNSSGNDISVADGELAQALSAIGDVEIIGFDACLMQMWEVMENVSPYAECMVGSEETESAEGWNYTGFLQDLYTNPGMDPIALGNSIISHTTQTTLSVVDLAQIGNLRHAVDTFALELMRARDQGYTDTIKAARNRTQNFYEYSHIDLYDFAENVKGANVPGYLKTFAQDLMNSINNIVKGTHNSIIDAHGVAVYHPSSPSYYENSYSRLEVAQLTKWDEYLRGCKYNDSLGIYGGVDTGWVGTDTIRYDGVPYSFWGYDGDPSFYAGVRFTTPKACTVKAVCAFFNHEFNYTLYIYDGGEYLMPGVVLHSQSGTSHHCWNYIELTSPVVIESEGDFWACVYAENAYYPIGVDNGAWAAHRSYCSFDGKSWQEALENNTYYNFNIRAEVRYYLETPIEETNKAKNLKAESRKLAVYPNPFSTLTKISYAVDGKTAEPQNSKTISLRIYDASGRLVKQFNHLTIQPFNQVAWQGDDDLGRKVPAGVYFVELATGDYKKVEKAILLR